MIRKNPNNKNNSNDQIDFDYYLPEYLKEDSVSSKEKNTLKNNKNNRSLEDVYNSLPDHKPEKKTGKMSRKETNFIPAIKPKKLLKICSIVLIGLLGVYFILNAPLYYYRFLHMKKVDQQQQNNNAISNIVTEENIEKKAAPTDESRLLVPKIGVDAPIIFADSTNEKDIQEALRDGVVHYFRTAVPGENGNVFISGHSSNYWWEKGSYNYVFSLLDRMEVGDTATVYYKGYVYEYTVYEKFIVNPTEVSVLAQTKKPILTLMTCTPPGTDFRRLIVRLDQTFPSKNETAKQATEAPRESNEVASNKDLPRDKKNFVEYIGDFISSFFSF